MNGLIQLDVTPLMSEEELHQCELTINAGLQTYIEVGKALTDIRDKKGYRFRYGTFEEYVESRWKMSISSAYNRIAAASVIENVQPVGQIGFTSAVALSQLAPEQQREFAQSHDVEHMKKREVEAAVAEWKKRLAKAEGERDAAVEQAQSLIERAAKYREENERLKREKNPEPQVVEKTVEVEIVPAHIQNKLVEDDRTIQHLRADYEEVKQQLEALKIQQVDDYEPEVMQKKRERLRLEADISTLQIRSHAEEFLTRVSRIAFLEGALASAAPDVKRKLIETLDSIESWHRKTKQALNSRIIVEEAQYREG